jgi:hypothetical protein
MAHSSTVVADDIQRFIYLFEMLNPEYFDLI